MSLFNSGSFRLHSGQLSSFKIDCDALSDTDWQALAALIGPHLRFSRVVGVPTGGLRFAKAMAPYATHGPVLIVDDVLTTGASMEEVAESLGTMVGYTGLVLYARGIPPLWVTPVFRMTRFGQ